MDFSNWLYGQLKERDWSQSDLAHASGLTRQTISYYLSEKSKQPDEFALKKIASALKLPTEQVYRAAGIPLSPSDDETLDRIEHLYNALKEPASKQQALDFLEHLMNLESRGKNGKKGKGT